MGRALILMMLAGLFGGCASSYSRWLAAKPSNGDAAANYVWGFQEPVPANVTLVNFGTVTYSREVNGDIFEGTIGRQDAQEHEFELVVPRKWIATKARRFGMGYKDNWFVKGHTREHLARAPKWYAPKGFDAYEVFTDATRPRHLLSTGDDPAGGLYYMFVEKAAEADGRWRVFFTSTVEVGEFRPN